MKLPDTEEEVTPWHPKQDPSNDDKIAAAFRLWDRMMASGREELLCGLFFTMWDDPMDGLIHGKFVAQKPTRNRSEWTDGLLARFAPKIRECTNAQLAIYLQSDMREGDPMKRVDYQNRLAVVAKAEAERRLLLKFLET